VIPPVPANSPPATPQPRDAGGESWSDVGSPNGRHAPEGPDFSQLYRIRPFDEADAPVCRGLYRDGLLGGRLAENDSALDIDDIRSAYLLDPLNGFWVAEVTKAAPRFSQWLPAGAGPGCLVGMVGVQHHEEGVGEIRRLRVHPEHRRRGLGSRLLETAIRFCRDSGCLKVQLDTFVEREAAMKLFERFHFRHGRTRKVGGKELLYFYLDLYTQERRSE
jgi:ribosomal protein S18 acetylase RimI-like enzyme